MSLDLTDWQNKKFSTKGGSPVRLLCVDSNNTFPIVGLVKMASGKEIIYSWRDDGVFDDADADEDGNDLINAKTKKEGWVNVYAGHQDGHYATLYKNKAFADLGASKNRIACVKIEWEE